MLITLKNTYEVDLFYSINRACYRFIKIMRKKKEEKSGIFIES